jgi:hypothetical protein
MKLRWRYLLALVSGMVLVHGSAMAIDCEETTREAREQEMGLSSHTPG